jgi:hypothetical protein
MFDDPCDIDRNGIPDAIQRDPVVAPEEPVPFSLFPPEPAGLPGIDSPIEATAEIPMPVEPVAPPADADEATVMRYQLDLQKYNPMLEMYSKIMANSHEMKKAMIDNIG